MKTVGFASLILLLAACGDGASSALPLTAPDASTGSTPAAPTASAEASTPPGGDTPTTAPATDDTAEALLALIPDELCGGPVSRYTRTGEAAAQGNETDLKVFRELGMTDEAQMALGMSLPTGCAMSIYRFPGTDPARLRSVIEQEYFPGGPASTTSVGDREVLVKDADHVIEYWFFEGDTMATVVAPTADEAAEIVAALPRIS